MARAALAAAVLLCVLHLGSATQAVDVGPFEVVADESDAFQASDLVSGQPGVPLRLVVTVAESGAPRAGVRLDYWSADASGLYSDEAQLGTAGQHWLRGWQVTDAEGVATFNVVVPGRYPGRTNHVHLRVRDGGNNTTTQLFFPEDAMAVVRAVSPYASVSERTWSTSNARDPLYAAENEVVLAGSTLDGYTASYLLALPLSGSSSSDDRPDHHHGHPGGGGGEHDGPDGDWQPPAPVTPLLAAAAGGLAALSLCACAVRKWRARAGAARVVAVAKDELRTPLVADDAAAEM